MTNTPSHAAPWTWRRLISCLFTSHTRPSPDLSHTLTGPEATARHLFGESVQWSRLDMLNYDRSPYLQSHWLFEADRRIEAARDRDRHVAAWHGKTPEQWEQFTPLKKRDMREAYYKAKGMAA